MDNYISNFQNIIDKNTLQEHLTFMALFIGLYENQIDLLESRIESFFCTDLIINEKKEFEFKKSKKYKEEILNRKVDKLGNKNKLMSMFLWLLDVGAITDEDKQVFINAREIRNKYVHQMSNFIWDGLDEKDADLLMSTLNLFIKIDKWWINEIEIPIAGEVVPMDYDKERVESLSISTFRLMINILYNEHYKP